MTDSGRIFLHLPASVVGGPIRATSCRRSVWMIVGNLIIFGVAPRRGSIFPIEYLEFGLSEQIAFPRRHRPV
jgi:hypothetical protein